MESDEETAPAIILSGEFTRPSPVPRPASTTTTTTVHQGNGGDDEERQRPLGQVLGPALRERAEEEAKRQQREAETIETKFLEELRREGRKRNDLWQRFLEEQAKVLLGRDPERSHTAYAWAARLSETAFTEDFPDAFYDFLKFSIAEDLRPLSKELAEEAEQALDTWKKGRAAFKEARDALRQLSQVGGGKPTIALVPPEIMNEINMRLASYTKLITVPARLVARSFRTARIMHPAHTPIILEESYARGLGDPTFRPSKDTKVVEDDDGASLALFLRATEVYHALGDPLGFLDAYQTPEALEMLRLAEDPPRLTGPLPLRPKELQALQSALYAALYIQLGYGQLNSPAKFERVAQGLAALDEAGGGGPEPVKGWTVRSAGFTGVSEFVEERTRPPPDPARMWAETAEMIANLTAVKPEDLGKPPEGEACTPGFSNLIFKSLMESDSEKSYARALLDTNAALIDSGKVTAVELTRMRIETAAKGVAEMNQYARDGLDILVQIDKDDPDEVKNHVRQRVQMNADAIISACSRRSEYRGLMAEAEAVRTQAADAMEVERQQRRRKRGREGDEEEGSSKRPRNEPPPSSSAPLRSGDDIKGEEKKKDDDSIRLAVADEVAALLLGSKMYISGVLSSAANPMDMGAFAGRFDENLALLGYEGGAAMPLSKFVTGNDQPQQVPPGSARRMKGSELPTPYRSAMPSQTRRQTRKGNPAKRDSVSLKPERKGRRTPRPQPQQADEMEVEQEEAPPLVPAPQPPPPPRGGKRVPEAVRPETMSYWDTAVEGSQRVVDDLRKQFEGASTLQALTIAAITVGTSTAMTYALCTGWTPFEGFGNLMLGSLTSAADKIGAISDADAGYVITSLGTAQQWLNVGTANIKAMFKEVTTIETRTRADLGRIKTDLVKNIGWLNSLGQRIANGREALGKQIETVRGIQTINQTLRDTVANGNKFMINGADPTPVPPAPSTTPQQALATCDAVGGVLESVGRLAAAANGGGIHALSVPAIESGAMIGGRTSGCQLSSKDEYRLQQAFKAGGAAAVLPVLDEKIDGVAATVTAASALPLKDLGIALGAELAAQNVIANPEAALAALRRADELAEQEGRELARYRAEFNTALAEADGMLDTFIDNWKRRMMEQLRGSSEATKYAANVNNALLRVKKLLEGEARAQFGADYLKGFERRSAAHGLNARQAAVNSFMLNGTLTNEQQTAYDNLLKQAANEASAGTAESILHQGARATDTYTAAATRGYAQGTLAQVSHTLSNMPAILFNSLSSVPIVNRLVPVANIVYIRSGSLPEVDLGKLAQGGIETSPAKEYFKDAGSGNIVAKTAEEILRDRGVTRPTHLQYAEAMQRSIDAGRVINARKAAAVPADADSRKQELQTLGSVATAPVAMLMAVTGVVGALVDARMYAGLAGSIGRIGAVTGVSIEVAGKRMADACTASKNSLRARLLRQDAAATERLEALAKRDNQDLTGLRAIAGLGLDLIDFGTSVGYVVEVVGTGVTILSRIFLGISLVFARFGEDMQKAVELGIAIEAAGGPASKAAQELIKMRDQIAVLPRAASAALRQIHTFIDTLSTCGEVISSFGLRLIQNGAAKLELSAGTMMLSGLGTAGMMALQYAPLVGWLIGPWAICAPLLVGLVYSGGAEIVLGSGAWLFGQALDIVVKNRANIGTIAISAAAVGMGAAVAYATVGMFSTAALGMLGVRVAVNTLGRKYLRPLFINLVDQMARYSTAPGVDIMRDVDYFDEKSRKWKKKRMPVPSAELLKKMSPLKKLLFSGAYVAAEAFSIGSMMLIREGTEHLAARTSWRQYTRIGREEAKKAHEERTQDLQEVQADFANISRREAELEQLQLRNTIQIMESERGYRPAQTSSFHPPNDKWYYTRTTLLRDSLDITQASLDLTLEHAAALEALHKNTVAYDQSMADLQKTTAMGSVEQLLEHAQRGISDLLSLVARQAPLV